MRITSKGQVTIPLSIRKTLGLVPNTEVELEISGNSLCIQKLRGKSRGGKELLSRMGGKGSVRMSTDEIMALTRGLGRA